MDFDGSGDNPPGPCWRKLPEIQSQATPINIVLTKPVEAGTEDSRR
jgi:hypothetical protein